MEMIIKGMQVTATTITNNCRETHGQEKALEIALNEIRKKYEFTLSADVNKNATIRIVMTVDRDN